MFTAASANARALRFSESLIGDFSSFRAIVKNDMISTVISSTIASTVTKATPFSCGAGSRRRNGDEVRG